MGPATPGLVPLLLLLLAPYLNSASVIGRGDAHSLLRDACPAGSEACPEFGSAPAAALKYLVCGATKNVILVTVGLVDHPRLKAPSWLSPQRLLAVQVDLSDTSQVEGAVELATGACKRFKVKKVFDLSPGAPPRPLAGFADLLVSSGCDTKGAFARPGHVIIVSERPLNAAEADVLPLGGGVSVYRLPTHVNLTLPACFEPQRRTGRRPPEEALLLADTEPDVDVPCRLGHQPSSLGCPICVPYLTDELKDRACTAPAAFIVRRNAERLAVHDPRKPWFVPKLEISQTAPLRSDRKINIRVQERRPLGTNGSDPTKCVQGTLAIFDDVSPGGIDTATKQINFIMRSHCSCEFLTKDAGYAVLLHSKPIPKPGRMVQLDESFTIVSLPKGVTNLTSCAGGDADSELMLGDQPALEGAAPRQRQALPARVPQSCPVCHSDLEPDLYNPICEAQTVVRMLSLSPAFRDPSGTYFGKARIVQSVRGAGENVHDTLTYAVQDTCNCDYVAKASRQYFVFMGPLPTTRGKVSYLPMTDKMHILAYSYRNARLLHDAMSACPAAATTSIQAAEKRMDTQEVADQAVYGGSYGGASGPLYGSPGVVPLQADSRAHDGYGAQNTGRSAPASYGAPSGVPSSPSYGGGYAASYGSAPSYNPGPSPSSAVPTATAVYPVPSPNYAATPLPQYRPAPPPPSYKAASAPSYGDATAAPSYGTPSSGYGATAAPAYGSLMLPPTYKSPVPAVNYGASAVTAGYAAPSPSYGVTSSPNYGAQASAHGSGYGSAAAAPNYSPSYAASATASSHYPAKPADYSNAAHGSSGPSYASSAHTGTSASAYRPAANYGAATYSQPPYGAGSTANKGYVGSGGYNAAPASGHIASYGSGSPSYGSASAGSSSYGSAPAASYGSAPSYNPGPSPSSAVPTATAVYPVPSPNYAATPLPQYGPVPPHPSYEAPSAPSYGDATAAPSHATPSSGYGATAAPAYGSLMLPPTYKSPVLAVNYGASAVTAGYAAPSPSYGVTSSPNYGAQGSAHGSGYGLAAAAPNYSPSYAASATASSHYPAKPADYSNAAHGSSGPSYASSANTGTVASAYGPAANSGAATYSQPASTANKGYVGSGGYNAAPASGHIASYGAGSPSYASASAGSSPSYGSAPAASYGASPSAVSNYGSYGGGAHAYVPPPSVSYGPAAAAGYGSATPSGHNGAPAYAGSTGANAYGAPPSSGVAPAYAPASNAAYGSPGANTHGGSSSGGYDGGSAAAYGQASSSASGSPAYGAASPAAQGSSAYGSYSDVTYVPPYGIAEYPPSFYQPLYPSEDEQPTVISYVPTYPTDEESYAARPGSYGNGGGYSASSATYAPSAYAAPAYGSNYAPETKSFTVAPYSAGGGQGYDSPYGTHAPSSAGNSGKPSYAAPSSNAYSAPSHGAAANPAHGPSPPAPAHRAPEYPPAGGSKPSYGGPTQSQLYGSGSSAASAVSYAPPAQAAPAYSQPSYGGARAVPSYATASHGHQNGNYEAKSNSAGSSGSYQPASYGSMPSYSHGMKPYGQNPAPVQKSVHSGQPSYNNAPASGATYSPPSYSAPSYGQASSGGGSAYAPAGHKHPQYSSAAETGYGAAYATTAGYGSIGGQDASYGMAPSYRSPTKAYDNSQGRNPAYSAQPSASYSAPAYGKEATQTQQPAYEGSSSSQTYTTSSYGAVSYTTHSSGVPSYGATYAPAAHNGPAYSQPSSNAPKEAEAPYSAPSGGAEYSGASYSAPSYNEPSYSVSSAPPAYVPPAAMSYAHSPSYAAPSAPAPSYAHSPAASAGASNVEKPYSHTMSPPTYSVASYAPPAYAAPSYARPAYAVSYAPPAYAAPAYFVAVPASPSYSQPSYVATHAPPAYSAPVYAPMAPYGSAPQQPAYAAPVYVAAYAPAVHVPSPYAQPAYSRPVHTAPLYRPNVQPSYAAPVYPPASYVEQRHPPYNGPQYSHPSYNQPQYGATHAPPAYLAPSYEASYAPPAYSAPSYVQPSNLVSHAPPAYPAPSYPQPAYNTQHYSPSYAPPAYSAPSYPKPLYMQQSYGASSAPPVHNAPAYGESPYSQPAYQATAAHASGAQYAPAYGSGMSATHVQYPAGHHAMPTYGVNAAQHAAYNQPSYPRNPQPVVTVSYNLPSQPLPSYYSPAGQPAYGVPASALAAAYGSAKPSYSPAPMQRPAYGAPAPYAAAGAHGASSSGQLPAYGVGTKPHATSAPHSYAAPSSYGSAGGHGSGGGSGAYGAPGGATSYGNSGGGASSYGQGAPQQVAYTTSSYSATPTYESSYTTSSGQSQYTTYGTPSSHSPSYTTYSAPSSQAAYTTSAYSQSTYTTYSPYSQQSYTTYGTLTAYSPATTYSPAPSYPESDYESQVYNSAPTSYGPNYATPGYSSAPTYSPPSYGAPSYGEPSLAPPAYAAGYTTAGYSGAAHASQGYSAPSYSSPAHSGQTYRETSHPPPTYSAPAPYAATEHSSVTYAPHDNSAASYAPASYAAPSYAPPTYMAPGYTTAGYSGAAYSPPAPLAGGYGEATYAPPGHPAPGYHPPSLSEYRSSERGYSAPSVQPGYGRSVQPEAGGRYAPAKVLDTLYSEAYPIETLAVEAPSKPQCPQAMPTCPVCAGGLHQELLNDICNYDLVAEAEVSYPPQPGKAYGGMCSEMCIGDIFHGQGYSVMDKIRFSVNKYCSCEVTSKSFTKVILLSYRHNWRAHGGSYGQLLLDDKTVLLPHKANTVKAIQDALRTCQYKRRYPAPRTYADAAYAGPAGCPDPFDESCPQCSSTVAMESLVDDVCSAEYAAVVAIGLDYQKMAEYKNGQFTWKQAYLPGIQVTNETGFGKNLSVVIKVNGTPSENASTDQEPSGLMDSCMTYTVKALYNVSRGMNPVEDTYDLQLFLNRQCPCQQLKSQIPGYAILVVDKKSKLSDGSLQLGTGAKLYPLPYGMHTLTPCSVDKKAELTGRGGGEHRLPLPELEIPVEDSADVADEGPCPENIHATCPVCLDASEEPAATVTQYCKSNYAAVVSIPDDALSSSTDSAIQPWWAPKISLSVIPYGSYAQINVNVKPKARYQFPETDRTVGHADNGRKCRSGRLHVKQEVTAGHREEAVDAVKFTILSACKCSFLEQPTRFALLASKQVPEGGHSLHLSEDVTLVGLPLGKTELPQCVRPVTTKKPMWSIW